MGSLGHTTVGFSVVETATMMVSSTHAGSGTGGCTGVETDAGIGIGADNNGGWAGCLDAGAFEPLGRWLGQ